MLHIAGGVFLALVAFQLWSEWRVRRQERKAARAAERQRQFHAMLLHEDYRAGYLAATARTPKGSWAGAWAFVTVIGLGLCVSIIGAIAH